MDCDIEFIAVPLFNPKTQEEKPRPLACIFPDKMAAALMNEGEELFRSVFLGNSVDPLEYWEHVKQRCAWCKAHPAFQVEDASKLIPLSLYVRNLVGRKGGDSKEAIMLREVKPTFPSSM